MRRKIGVSDGEKMKRDKTIPRITIGIETV